MIPSLFRGRQRAAANLVFYTASMVGFSLGMVLGGLAFGWVHAQVLLLPASLQSLEAWRVVFFAVALPGPVFALLVMAIRAEHGRAAAPPMQLTQPRPAGNLLPYLRKHWRTLAGVFGSAAACVSAFSPIMAWLAPVLTRVFGVPPSEAGVQLGAVLGAASLVGIGLATLSQRRWGARYGDALAMQTGQYLAAAALLPAALLGVVESAQWALGAVFVLGALAVAFSALLPGLWQGIAPAPLRARVIALAGAAMAVSGAVGPLAVGGVSDLLADHPNGLLMAIAAISAPLMLLSAVLMRWVRKPLQVTLELGRLQQQ
jgi:MFS family permease